MRGFLKPGVVAKPSGEQTAFQALSRHRRSKLARAANTTLVKADQWGRGETTPPELAAALQGALAALHGKNAKAGKKTAPPAAR